ncbi:ribokinase [Corynebacterium poyangense]|uniref:Ribokinase n=1 Tax=Corynebacterium poyangense TaxID=2684405 RepID=A0A7H0SQ42_9CORY|nr:ribokinase [Corynebacterium poyangense]QNQ90667.1 ribokinase [Corynebacterium poyangense]
MSDVVVVGSINADLTVRVSRHPHPGETLLGTSEGVTPGGKGANQALAAALQGAKVSMIGAIGRDANAPAAIQLLQSAGVDLSGVAETSEGTGLAVITVSDDGENTIIVVPGANATVDEAYVSNHQSAIAEAQVVILQGEIPADGFKKAVDLASDAHTRVLVNLAPVIAVDEHALLQANPLMSNEHEAGLILQQLGQGVDSDDPELLAGSLLQAGFASVVLTLGSQGSLVAESDASGQPVFHRIPATPVEAVDTTGAGDAFAGAFAARLVEGDDLVAAARYASRVGAFAVTGTGAQPSYPSLKDSLPPEV